MDIFLCLLFAVLKDATIDSMHIFLRVSHVLMASSYEPGRPGWLGFRDLASPLFSLQKLRFVHIKRRVGPVTEILVAELEIFPI